MCQFITGIIAIVFGVTIILCFAWAVGFVAEKFGVSR